VTGASTVRCYALKQLFAVHVPRCAQLFCLSQRAIVLCNPQIMISVLGRRADCREAEISFFQVAIVFCLLQCIRHGCISYKEEAALERRRRLRSVTTAYMLDHDVVAAPFADGHIATVISASISPIIVATVSPIVIPIKIATFALTPAVGPDTDVERV
jgi:hypothetical protein